MNEQDAIRILKEFAPDEKDFKIIYNHSDLVKEIALKISKNIKSDKELLITGSLLHDIGRFNLPPGSKNSISHGIRGARILRKLGLKKEARIAERHIGAGISVDDINKQGLALPLRDFSPKSIEEKIICYADSLTENNKEISFDKTVKRFKKEIGPEIVDKFNSLRKDLIEAGMKEKY